MTEPEPRAQLTDIAGGDDALARILRDQLQRLVGAPAVDPKWRELARDVLAGRVSLRDAVRSEAYSDLFASSAQALREWSSRHDVREQQAAADRAIALHHDLLRRIAGSDSPRDA